MLASILIAATVTLGLPVAAGRAQQPRPPARASISTMAWLGHTWVADTGPATVEERWTAPAGGAMLAVSRTVTSGRMVAFEYLRIVERNGGLVYIAQPNGQPPTEFVLTALTAQDATFENPAHDFPKMIRYRVRPDGMLEARVSDGGQRGETFLFARTP